MAAEALLALHILQEVSPGLITGRIAFLIRGGGGGGGGRVFVNGGASPFLVDGIICLVNSGNEQDCSAK